MSKFPFSVSRTSSVSVSIQTRAIPRDHPGAPDPWHRQKLLPGWNQEVCSSSLYLICGAGGPGSSVAYQLARQGANLIVADPDVVDITNLSRQLFFERDIGDNKAHALVRNLAAHAVTRQRLVGVARTGQEQLREMLDRAQRPDVVGVFIDSTPDTIALARLCREARPEIPAVYAKLSRDADAGFVMIQEANGPCINCIQHYADDEYGEQCPAGATIDIATTAAGFSVFAMHSVLMRERPRTWNYREWSLSGDMPSRLTPAEPWIDCPVCSAANRAVVAVHTKEAP